MAAVLRAAGRDIVLLKEQLSRDAAGLAEIVRALAAQGEPAMAEAAASAGRAMAEARVTVAAVGRAVEADAATMRSRVEDRQQETRADIAKSLAGSAAAIAGARTQIQDSLRQAREMIRNTLADAAQTQSNQQAESLRVEKAKKGQFGAALGQLAAEQAPAGAKRAWMEKSETRRGQIQKVITDLEEIERKEARDKILNAVQT